LDYVTPCHPVMTRYTMPTGESSTGIATAQFPIAGRVEEKEKNRTCVPCVHKKPGEKSSTHLCINITHVSTLSRDVSNKSTST
jgi:hypothetical protein